MTFQPGQIPEGATPFLPGQSGNPAGRPPGSRNRATLLRELLDLQAQVTVDGQAETTGTVEGKVAAALINKALRGDVQAIREVYDSVYGKLTERQDITSGGQPLTARVEVVPAGPPVATSEKDATTAPAAE